MLTRIFSCAVICQDRVIVDVDLEADISPGLPDAAVQKSRRRVLAVIRDTERGNSGLDVKR